VILCERFRVLYIGEKNILQR